MNTEVSAEAESSGVTPKKGTGAATSNLVG